MKPERVGPLPVRVHIGDLISVPDGTHPTNVGEGYELGDHCGDQEPVVCGRAVAQVPGAKVVPNSDAGDGRVGIRVGCRS